MSNDWKKEFRDLFFKGVKRYEAGRQSPGEMFEGDDAQGIDKVFVLGNGPSRANIDPSKLDGTVIGLSLIHI